MRAPRHIAHIPAWNTSLHANTLSIPVPTQRVTSDIVCLTLHRVVRLSHVMVVPPSFSKTHAKSLSSLSWDTGRARDIMGSAVYPRAPAVGPSRETR